MEPTASGSLETFVFILLLLLQIFLLFPFYRSSQKP